MDIIFHIWSIHRHIQKYIYSIYTQYICHLCEHVSISQRPWWFEPDIEAGDKMCDVLGELLVLKFSKMRVSLECIWLLWLLADLWVSSKRPFISSLKSRNCSPMKTCIWRVRFCCALWAGLPRGVLAHAGWWAWVTPFCLSSAWVQQQWPRWRSGH